MTLRLECVRESEKARLYRFKDGRQIWVPRSVVRSTTKFPPASSVKAPVHELNIEEWWLAKQNLL